MVSHQFRDMVKSTRTTYPHIIWEERRPTQIGYETYYEESHAVTGARADFAVSVTQFQNFRFILLTDPQNGPVQVEYKLTTGIWDEQNNNRNGDDCRDYGSPMETRPRIVAFVPKKSNQTRCNLLYLNHPGSYQDDGDYEDDDWICDFGRDHSDCFRGDEIVPDIRSAMEIIWKCSQRIAVYPDGIAYPSAEYLMQKLPRRLLEHFSSYFFSTDPTKRHRDCETAVELIYRPPPTLEEWKACVPSIDDIIKIHNVQELPWYRNGDNSCDSSATVKRQKLA